MVRVTDEKLRELLNETCAIRNVAIVGDCGDETRAVVEALASETNRIEVTRGNASSRTGGSYSTRNHLAITPLVVTMQEDQRHLINMVELPESLKDLMEIEAALALVDGVVVIVNPAVGIGLFTETIVTKAVTLKKKIVLVVNTHKDQSPRRCLLYEPCVRVVETLNAIIRRVFCADLLPVSEWIAVPEIGNVVFGSAVGDWGLTLASLTASLPKTDTIDEGELLRRLWAGWCYDAETDQWLEKHTDNGTLDRLFDVAILQAASRIESASAAGVLDSDDSWVHVPEQSCLSLSDAILRAVVRHVPPPVVSSPYIEHNGVDEQWVNAVRRCDPSGPLVVHVVKMGPATESNEMLAIGRVLSVTLSLSQAVNAAPHTLRESSPRSSTEIPNNSTRVTLIGLGSGNRLDVGQLEVPAGNLCAFFGLDSFLYKTGVVTTCDPTTIMASRFFRRQTKSARPKPLLRVFFSLSDEPNARKLCSELEDLLRADLSTTCSLDGNQVELVAISESSLRRWLAELEDCVHDRIQYTVSQPFFCFQETVTRRSPQTIMAKAPAKHIQLFCTAEPLVATLVDELTSPLLAHQPVSVRKDRLVSKYGWREQDARRVLPDVTGKCGPNVLVDATTTPHQFSRILEHQVIHGFTFGVHMGVLCFEPVAGIRVNWENRELTGAERHWGFSQGCVAMRTAVFACQLVSSPALLEPVLAVEVRWEALTIAIDDLCKVLTDRRGVVVRIDETSKTLRARLPARESLGIKHALEGVVKTTTKLAVESVLDRFQRIAGDPLDATSEAGALVRELRLLKKLTPDVPPLSRFHYEH